MAGGDTLVLCQNHTRVGGEAGAGEVVSREPFVGRAQADKFKQQWNQISNLKFFIAI